MRLGPRLVDVLRWRLFPVSDGARGAEDENPAFVLLDGKTSGEAVDVSCVYMDGADSFPGWGGLYCQDSPAARIYTSPP